MTDLFLVLVGTGFLAIVGIIYLLAFPTKESAKENNSEQSQNSSENRNVKMVFSCLDDSTKLQYENNGNVLFPCWEDSIEVYSDYLLDSDIDFAVVDDEVYNEVYDDDDAFIGEQQLYSRGLTKAESLECSLEQNKLCPFLSPERYRRRVKMYYGIDVNDYPIDKKIQLTQPRQGRLEDDTPSTLSLYPCLRRIEPIKDEEFKENIKFAHEYVVRQNKWLFISDLSAYKEIAEYDAEHKRMNTWVDYANRDIRYAQYNGGIFDARDELMEYMDKFIRFLEPNRKIDIAGGYFRYTDLRLDAIYIYIHKVKTETERKLWNPLGKSSSMPDYEEAKKYIFIDDDGGFYAWNYDDAIEERISKMLAHKQTPWNGYIPEAGVAAYLNFLLHFNEGQSAVNSYRNMLAENNYFGYGLLREFCEGHWRHSSLRAKMLESYRAFPKTNGIKLWLEPQPYAFDIDVLNTTDELKIIELGHDDYYFVEVMLPVESPVWDENGYAKILDRKEKVKGYVKRSEITIKEKLNEGVGLEKEDTTAYEKNPYLLLYMLRYKDVKNAIDGKLSVNEVVNIDCDTRIGVCDQLLPGETFLYWEVKERPDYVIVQTESKIRGFVEKSKVKSLNIQKLRF